MGTTTTAAARSATLAWRPVTASDWASMQRDLSGRFGSVKLRCDSYLISIERALIDKNSLGLLVYVNGFIRGEWLINDCEERRRFLRKSMRRVFSAVDVEKICKGLGKRDREACIKRLDLERKREAYSFHWGSFDALRRHLIAHNRVIQVQHWPYAIVAGAGTDQEHVVGHSDRLTDAIDRALQLRCDVMKCLEDGSMTTEF
ncbi:hypothetical protein [Sphaerotilus uruguayifluvii]|uniref:Uncharacterized protein n=1 Tax=Sphaerotilus uruguayifluvii TaxID=2735897 RepID=A0ABX2FXN0_9BURK|nr:hypothetical protein [Leptothrix sp. C29]NRT54783.1 hypothetical protein [Leptothrix sp. C29]